MEAMDTTKVRICDRSRECFPLDEMSTSHVRYFPGPISLIFGSESPLHSQDLSRHFPRRRKRNLSCTSAPEQHVHHVSLLGCQFHDIKDSFTLLGKKLKRESRLKELAICDTTPRIGNLEMMHIAYGLSSNTKLRLLDLTGAGFDDVGLSRLKSFFEKNYSLEVLTLADNAKIGDKGLQVVLSALQNRSSNLRVLNLEAVGTGIMGASLMSSLIGSIGSSLRILELSRNALGDTGVEKLSECIKLDSCRLECLGLNSVGLGDRGLLKLADSLERNRSLHSLNLQRNVDITDVGASQLLKTVYNTDSLSSIVSSNHVLKNIDMRGCVNISESTFYMIDLFSSQTVRFKVSKYFENFGCFSALGSLDYSLLPNILAFVGQKNGLDGLFRTVRSIPLLYTNPSEEESSKMKEESAFFLEQSKPVSRRRKLYCFFSGAVPQIRGIIRCMDSRNRNKHECQCRIRINSYLDSALSSENVSKKRFALSTATVWPTAIAAKDN
ncbi:hypothetical protein HJC23_012844 [Cyclotella cryptica]|uniref:Uncharacterized protein n=1 Tax=Cyclotella cryptica TaxID=29204 RepID=A0ABD3Q2D6_9STRA|eukprot:CCRYP_009412-RA/>CCRYP_009412-RA protein AED:0.30 eAED:0.30 QI:0/-1/0/1/-1/1/1/0/495